MADSESFPETTDRPAADNPPTPATITVTRNLPPNLGDGGGPSSGPGSATEPARRDGWRPSPASDATPVASSETDGPTHFQVVTKASAKIPGMPDIPGYEIIAEIGRGGMGVVYKARQLDLNRPVALKMIIGEYERPEQLMRFRIEAETAARVHHPNVVQVYRQRHRATAGRTWCSNGSMAAPLASMSRTSRSRRARPPAPSACWPGPFTPPTVPASSIAT